ncbi:hypothetical protein AA3271_1515 [Gluconobacter japonicus NBRC 3271]|nr:hypothetical protein AA3271_1515 [Gluconobacter japonicus NBRC 3271]
MAIEVAGRLTVVVGAFHQDGMQVFLMNQWCDGLPEVMQIVRVLGGIWACIAKIEQGV